MRLRWPEWLSKFIGDPRGGVQGIAVIALPVLAIAIAGGIEFVDASRMRSNLQGIADSTALNGARQFSIDPSTATLTRVKAWADGMLATGQGKWTLNSSVTADKTAGSVTVGISGNRTSFFGSLSPSGNVTINVAATGIVTASYPLCALGLQPAVDAIGLQGNASLTAQDCLVQSNGNIAAQGSATLRAGAVRASGRSTGDVAPTPVLDAPMVKDPFSALPIDVPALCSDVAIQLGTGTVNLNPGVHCGAIQLVGSGTLVLNPGEHYFLGPAFSLAGDLTIKGTDVVMIFKGQAGASITGNVTLSLEARKTGPYAGFALITDRSFTGSLAISAKNAKKILGTIYLPAATLDVSGAGNRIADQSPWTIVVAKAITAKGSPQLVINSAYATSDTPVPTGVGPGAVRLTN